jgi:hypothetical protein
VDGLLPSLVARRLLLTNTCLNSLVSPYHGGETPSEHLSPQSSLHATIYIHSIISTAYRAVLFYRFRKPRRKSIFPRLAPSTET